MICTWQKLEEDCWDISGSHWSPVPTSLAESPKSWARQRTLDGWRRCESYRFGANARCQKVVCYRASASRPHWKAMSRTVRNTNRIRFRKPFSFLKFGVHVFMRDSWHFFPDGIITWTQTFAKSRGQKKKIVLSFSRISVWEIAGQRLRSFLLGVLTMPSRTTGIRRWNAKLKNFSLAKK